MLAKRKPHNNKSSSIIIGSEDRFGGFAKLAAFGALNCQYTFPHVRECEVECSITHVTRH